MCMRIEFEYLVSHLYKCDIIILSCGQILCIYTNTRFTYISPAFESIMHYMIGASMKEGNTVTKVNCMLGHVYRSTYY